MKTKTLTKKLVVNKNTVANLEDKEMNQVQGGVLSIKICTFATNSCVSNPCC